ncbi:helix-turn-helix domain-containing protein [Demequina mangrovi]|uniref:Transcriptional regulator, XRE family with cupin sensor n=1 Tax=Demequina mangrovi TaxID=1043493 RepID=A0A1H6X5W1_9MICO|nr:XRE family transcriptional regulator [Demequina mangrovi]SEJ24549.1 transcriptional regulator, XRE family with cupin sensor [Demequina mangrovi]
MTAAGGEPDEAAARLGTRLRELRKARRLTLVQLADATGLSHPFLSQVERGLANLSLQSLRRIAVALETSPVELVAAAEPGEGASPRRIEVVRAGSRRPTPEGFARGEAVSLARGARPFTPILVESDAVEPGETFVHAEDEFVYVVAGSPQVEVDGKVHTLPAGDSVYYAGGVAHRWWSERPYRLLVVKQQVR